MQRIVRLPDGQRVVYEGVVIRDAWVVRTREANGHREVSFSNAVQWTELDEKPKWDLEDYRKNWPGMNLSLIELQFEKERLERQEKALRASHCLQESPLSMCGLHGKPQRHKSIAQARYSQF